jgi:DNA modification methylase
MNSSLLINADVLVGLRKLDSNSINTVVTSPPYWGLRNYGIDGQLGQEQTPEQYVENLVTVFEEVKRVLRNDGTVWLNLGDCYYGSLKGSGGKNPEKSSKQLTNKGANFAHNGPSLKIPKHSYLKPKDLVAIPWLTVIALQKAGWYLRSDVIWHKPNVFPESVKDRPTKAHEYIFLLTKTGHYYYDNEAIKELSESKPQTRKRPDGRGTDCKGESLANCGVTLYRNKRSVWSINTQSYKGAHFAVFPEKLVEPCILAGSPERSCGLCKEPYTRIIQKGQPILNAWSKEGAAQYDIQINAMKKTSLEEGSTLKHIVPTTTVGWRKNCSCDDGETICGVVLDPFSGSGTTGVVAINSQRNYIGIELNSEYVKLSKQRILENCGLESQVYEPS